MPTCHEGSTDMAELTKSDFGPAMQELNPRPLRLFWIERDSPCNRTSTYTRPLTDLSTEGLTKKIRELSEKLGIDPDVLLRGGPLSNKLSTRSIA